MRIGFVGWRGMVGSVLLDRMRQENDFDFFPDRVFFSTSDVGGQGPDIGCGKPLQDANDILALNKCEIIITCQGGDWTSAIYPRMREAGWNGVWIDSASTLRMKEDSVIVLDPINRDIILTAYKNGVKTFVGGNCTVSLMLMACHGLFKENLVEWINSTTYQAASGAGAANMQELIGQMRFISNGVNPGETALILDKMVLEKLRSDGLPRERFKVPLACNLIPWIDKPVDCGQTREEWKGFAEGNKILGREKNLIPVDGLCVRIGAMRCHSQALLIKLTRDISLYEINDIIASANQWIRVVPNEMDATVNHLTPAFISGNLEIAIGRIHKAKMGPKYLQAFTVGDQLLWGAAEPLRRALRIILELL